MRDNSQTSRQRKFLPMTSHKPLVRRLLLLLTWIMCRDQYTPNSKQLVHGIQIPASHIAAIINKIWDRIGEIVTKSLKPLENSWFFRYLSCFLFFLPLPIHIIESGNSLKMWLIIQNWYICGRNRILADDQKDNSVLTDQEPILWFLFYL